MSVQLEQVSHAKAQAEKERDAAVAGIATALAQAKKLEESSRAEQAKLQEKHETYVEELSKKVQERYSQNYMETLAVQAEAKEAKRKQRLAEEQLQAKKDEKALLDAWVEGCKEDIHARQRLLDEKLGEVEALRLEKSEAEREQKEQLRRSKEKIANEMREAIEGDKRKLEEQLMAKEKELSKAQDDYNEMEEDFIAPLTEQNRILMAKIDAATMATYLATLKVGDVVGRSLKVDKVVDPDHINEFSRKVKNLSCIEDTARVFLKSLSRVHVIATATYFTCSVPDTIGKDAAINMIMKSKFEK